MEPQFWRDRWAEGRIAFHEGVPNSFLTAYASRLAGPRVLVPLCGKTDDLAYLASLGHEVVGIELVEDAVRAFFTEHGLTPEMRGNRYSAGAITLIAGDFFAVTRDDVGPISSIYDRAALIALPPELRPRHVDHLRLIAPAPSLLVTLDYPQELMQGPPFSVPEAEVRALYPRVELLESRSAVSGRVAEFKERAFERCYAVDR